MKSAKQTNRQDKAMQDAVRMNVVRTYMESLTDQSEQIKRIEEKLLWLPEKVVDQIEHKQTMKIKDREDALMFMAMGAPVEISELAK
ncbi:hypothetical protein [Agrobacterium rosae]|uniref:hypothetical protein n=1 Tax=Agrobacterium rosae TaxID=1972867 RepID=UPI002033E53B|nr:hypothetical protein [Agrobacterium rosae]MCM2433194.1 hypothetical protein [Agrobacterium rosae]